MDDTSFKTPVPEQIDEEILACEVADDALEAAAGVPRLWTAMITDCPTIVAACCGGR